MRIFKTVLIVLISLLVGGGSVYFLAKMYPQYLGLSKENIQTASETDALISEVSKLISLPTDERPTVATVSDAEKIREQAFFKNAQNGDKVLIYTKAKKAILYRPSEKKVVEVGAVNIKQAEQPQLSPTPTASSIPQVTPPVLE